MRSMPMMFVLILTTFAAAGQEGPWRPDWSAEAGYTSQGWELHAIGGAAPAQPLAADDFSNNPYGTATARWDSSSPDPIPGFNGMSYVQWQGDPMGDHPTWVGGVYGGMADNAQATEGGTYGLRTSLPAISGSGSLQVFVQYDWYEYAGEGFSTVTPVVAGATDVTPGTYYDVELGRSGSGWPWQRSTKVFEFASNPGAFDVEFVIDGAAPMIDLLSVTTAFDADIPQAMPVPEPASLSLLAFGGLLLLRRRKRE
jgi:hypothetical protein